MKLSNLTWAALAALLATTSLQAQELRITHQQAGENMDALVAKFEAANPGVTVRQITFSTADYENMGLVTQLMSAEPPDIYFQWAGFPVERDVRTGTALDITDYLAGEWGKSFAPAFLAEGSGATIDGRTYLVPTAAQVYVTIWYNKNIFDELGLTPPETWDEFREVVKAVAAAGITPIVIGNQDAWPLGNWAGQIASRVVPADEYEAAFLQEASFSTPAFLEAFGLIEELHRLGAFNPDMAGMDQNLGMATFFQGAAAMNPIGSWLISNAATLAPEDFDYSNFNTPPVEGAAGEGHSVMGGATGFVVNAATDKPDLAIAFLRMLSSVENQREWAQRSPFNSTVLGALDGLDIDPNMIEMAHIWDSASSMIGAPDTGFPIPVAEAFYRAAAFVATGEMPAAEALSWLDEELARMGKQTL